MPNCNHEMFDCHEDVNNVLTPEQKEIKRRLDDEDLPYRVEMCRNCGCVKFVFDPHTKRMMATANKMMYPGIDK